MWLAVLMLAAMASGSAFPDYCQYRSPRVECSGHAPDTLPFYGLSDDFDELAIRDLADVKELDVAKYRPSNFLKRLRTLEFTNITKLTDIYPLRDYFNYSVPNVCKMNLSHNSLEGDTIVLETWLSTADRLSILDVGYNKIEGVHFDRLFNLTWLSLRNNEISMLEPLSFGPSSLYNISSSLQYLDLSNNNLHMLKGALSTLVSLRRLYLANNELKYFGSNSFMNLNKLIELDLRGNKFLLITPSALKPLVSLSILQIDDASVIDRNFSVLIADRQLKLTTGVPNVEFIGTPKMLSISTTTTTTTTNTTKPAYNCPDYCQCRPPRIECHSAEIHRAVHVNDFPDEFTELVINGANIYSFDPPSEWDGLWVLDLGNNKIHKLYSYFFMHRKTLKWLNLANNVITYTRLGVFRDLTVLEYLNLSNNSLYTLKGVLNPLVSLQRLFLAGNKLEHIDSTWFQNLTKLIELDVSRNKLTYISAEPLQPLVSLSVLKVSENPLIKRDLSLLLSTGRRLEIVDASRIGLTRIPAALTRSIRILKLAGNQLTSIDSGDFDSYPLLKELDLSDNRLIGIEEDALGRLDNLEELHLSSNILSAIPKSLPNGLKLLDLSQNALSSLKINDLQNLRSLVELNLSGNVIADIEAGFFRQLVALRQLDISDNPFAKLPSDTLDGPTNLMILRMSGLTSLKTEESQNQDTAFPFLTPENLVELDLSRSPALAAQLLADNAALSACKSLQVLDLAYTSIGSIRSDLAYVLPQLRRLNLIGNAWNCSDDQLWLGEWFRQHVSDEFSARCVTPEKFVGKLLRQIHAPLGSTSVPSSTEKSTTTTTTTTTTVTFGKTDDARFNTEIPKTTANKLSTESTTTSTTTTTTATSYVTTQYPLRIESSTRKNKEQPSATRMPASIKQESENPITASKESINLSTATYAEVRAANAKIWEPTRAPARSAPQTTAKENNQNKRPDATESTLAASTTIGKNKKEARSIPETTRQPPSSTASPTTLPTDTTTTTTRTTTTTASATITTSTAKKLLLNKLKPSTPISRVESTTSKEIKEALDREDQEANDQPQQSSDERIFSEFSHSKLLFANEEGHVNDEPSSSFAEELNSQASESLASRTSETLASGAHPGMLVLLGAAIVAAAAAALTVVLSRRATANRSERQYQRHENIEVHALTPTTELW